MEKITISIKNIITPPPFSLHTSNIGSLSMQNFNLVGPVISEIRRVHASGEGRIDDPAEANPTMWPVSSQFRIPWVFNDFPWSKIDTDGV